MLRESTAAIVEAGEAHGYMAGYDRFEGGLQEGNMAVRQQARVICELVSISHWHDSGVHRHNDIQ